MSLFTIWLVGLAVMFFGGVIFGTVFYEEIGGTEDEPIEERLRAMGGWFVLCTVWFISLPIFISVGLGTFIKKRYHKPLMRWVKETFKERE